MTERKPKDERQEDFVERLIRESRDRGELDLVEGKGKPLKFLGRPHDASRWLREKLEREHLSILPDSLELRRQADRALREVFEIGSERLVRERLEALNTRIRSVNRTTWTGPPTDLAPLDVDEWVSRWRTARSRGGRAG
ncbi:MAG TPA: DnaJ family domain-containing protein [Anaeromyxobacteraceae bacterium]|nr:DnaJ family domain-containing protein [Anaeromyxobacteraceae bacterium]